MRNPLARLSLFALIVLISAASAHAGEVNLYSYRQPFLIKPMLDEFTKRTGIRVNTVFANDWIAVSAHRKPGPPPTHPFEAHLKGDDVWKTLVMPLIEQLRDEDESDDAAVVWDSRWSANRRKAIEDIITIEVSDSADILKEVAAGKED